MSTDAKKPTTLLIVDDEAEIREIVEMNLAPLGISVLEASDGQQAIDIIRQHHVDVIISDLMMPRVSGIGLLNELRTAGFAQPFIFLTAYPSQDSTIQALRLGAFDYVEKPFEPDHLRGLVQEALRVSREMQGLGVSLVKQQKAKGSSGAELAIKEIQKLRTLRYDAQGSGKSSTEDRAKIHDMFVSEATSQLVFCEGSLKSLEQSEERAFELGYLFRVMQGIAVAAHSIGAKEIENLARAAEQYYATLRVRPRMVTKDLVELATKANQALRTAVATFGGAQVDQTTDIGSIIAALNQAATDIERAEVRSAS